MNISLGHILPFQQLSYPIVQIYGSGLIKQA